jgi:hypothetical protein
MGSVRRTGCRPPILPLERSTARTSHRLNLPPLEPTARPTAWIRDRIDGERTGGEHTGVQCNGMEVSNRPRFGDSLATRLAQGVCRFSFTRYS